MKRAFRAVTCFRLTATAAALLAAACTSRQQHDLGLRGFSPSGPFDERTRIMALEPGVTATIVAPARLDSRRRVDLILYALPNGNSTAQTMGRRLTDGLDWHYDIQHIAAQTRALRTMGLAQAVVVYLETDSQSWPAWRQRLGYVQANKRIVGMVERLRAEFATAASQSRLAVTLTGHSGGGSFMFGFLEGQDAVPDWLERIVFLDANYNFAPGHGETLARWLRRDAHHTLVSMAYDDREIMLDGRKVVSDSGGTWRATERMLRALRGPFALTDDCLGAFRRHRSSQIELLVHPNRENRILHTEMIGEMNGYMHALVVRRPQYEAGPTVLAPIRVYTRWIVPD